ncbi:carbohydrate esterase family 15 protein [Moniliophthora roreri MCA 2997]|uniref:(4-O-methyl)-D-glucuronate--lignin esterase n=1 Tax=Moniliophthora roreri (strain MCA 2997) TaxID=1381753 RepID=V2X2R7_MONRO|nr:carbohydrate esterase family 15 protein [Moniliophthora roreri MCA 2997]
MVLLSGSFLLLLSALTAGVAPGANAAALKPLACPAIPSNPTSSSNAKLPDPFTFADGTKVATLDDWTCRADEISQLIQTYELGVKPPKPSTLTASYSGGSLTINASEGGKSISFSASITLPSGSGPFPAIIALDGPSIPRPSNVAIITFSTNDMASQASASSRGQGKFYQLYGSNHSAGAMIAWSWGISRIIDALEITPSANIDTERLAVTGCSRNGKGALVAGAFEPRIALTIPQESGSGGSDCWRLSDDMMSNGIETQTAQEIVQENVWFSTAFDTFAQSSVNTLPFDHHVLMGLVAPRGLFVIDQIGIDWLGAPSSFGCMKAAHRIWDSLGSSDTFGFSQSAAHNHCSFPSSQQDQLNAFINRFLFDQPTNTDIQETAGDYTYTQGEWDDWTNPTLN